VYGVRVVISEEEWEKAVSESAHLFRSVGNLEKQTQQTLVALYQSFVDHLLREHYKWLTDNAITTVVGACEGDEQCFIFYFQHWRDAERFRRQFPGAKPHDKPHDPPLS
jgi:hypothetical protein